MFEMTYTAAKRIVDNANYITPKQCQWVGQQIQSSMIFEALRKEPNPALIAVLNKLLDVLKDSTSLFALSSVVDNLPQFRTDPALAKMSPKERDIELDVQLESAAEKECIRRETLGFAKPAKDAKEAMARVKEMKAALKAQRAEEKAKFLDAIEYVEEACASAYPQAVLDDVEVPEALIGSIYTSFYNELEKMVDSLNRLQGKLRLNPWQEAQLSALQEACRCISLSLGTTVDKVSSSLSKSSEATASKYAAARLIQQSATQTDEEAFGKDAGDLTTIDNPPKGAKSARRRVAETKDLATSRMGISGADMAQASGVK